MEAEKKKFNPRTKWIIISAISLLIITTVSAGVYNKYMRFNNDGPFGYLIEKISEDLDLTDQQKSQLETIKQELKIKMESHKTERETGIKEFEKMFRSDKLDREALMQLEAKNEQTRKEMKEFMMDKLVQFHSILTPEQRNKAADKMIEMKNKRREFKNSKEHNNESH